MGKKEIYDAHVCTVLFEFKFSPARSMKTACQALGLLCCPGGYSESMQLQNIIAAFERRAGSSDLCKLPMILLPDLDLGARDSISH